MSERITFREKTEGVCVEGPAIDYDGPKPVSIMEPRVKYVRGQVTDTPDPGFVACGDGREYCMLVTGDTHAEKLDKLEQVFYRVRDTQWMAGIGEFEIYISEESNWTTTIQPPLSDPTPQLASVFSSGGVSSSSRRGYLYRRGTSLYQHPSEQGAVAGAFGETYISGGSNADAESEYALWWRGPTNAFGFLQRWFRTAFNFSSNYLVPPGDTDPGGYVFTVSHSGEDAPTQLNCGATLIIEDTVAFIDNDGSGDPLSPANDLYINLSFNTATSYGGETSVGIHSSSSGAVAAGIDLILEVSDGKTLRCPLYQASSFGLDTFSGGTNFVLKATKYWPYATKDGSPAWDEDTGAPINGGPGG